MATPAVSPKKDPNWRKRPRFWTPERLDLLEECIEKGLSDRVIGQRLGCSANAVNIARKRHGIASRRRVILSGRQVALRLGIRCEKTVTKLIERGLLKGRRGQKAGPHRQWFVTEDDLLAFMEDPRGWPAWKPERIANRSLREWAEELRERKYLTIGEAADRLGFGTGAVNDWIHRGELPAIRWGNWWIKETDLIGFVPLCERPRKKVAA